MEGRVTVLAIDDDALVRRAFRRVLEYGGFAVTEAENGTAGLAAFRARTPGAVLLDLRMPGGTDGLEVLATLVVESPETPVLVVSGEGTVTDVVEALRRGAWDFVIKPVQDAELLLGAIRRGLEKSRLLRQNREYGESLRDLNQRLGRALEDLRADERGARQLQFQLLPSDGLAVGRFRCSRRIFPSRVLSGDFVDYFSLGDRFLGFYVADVAGHGAASAFMTAILTTLVGTYREALATRGDETILSPAELLGHLDDDLTKHDLDKHITMFYGVLDTSSGVLLHANAGAFPYPLVATGADVRELAGAGPPLNLPVPAKLVQAETVIEPGGRLLVATDGVLELMSARSHAETRQALAELLGRSGTIDDVLAGLSLGESTVLEDDVAILFLRREGADA